MVRALLRIFKNNIMFEVFASLIKIQIKIHFFCAIPLPDLSVSIGYSFKLNLRMSWCFLRLCIELEILNINMKLFFHKNKITLQAWQFFEVSLI